MGQPFSPTSYINAAKLKLLRTIAIAFLVFSLFPFYCAIAASPPLLMPLGDSNVKGIAGTDDDYGWRYDLQWLLEELGPAPYDFVGPFQHPVEYPGYGDPDHAGEGGAATWQVCYHLDGDLCCFDNNSEDSKEILESFNPGGGSIPAGSCVLLHAGANDILRTKGFAVQNSPDCVEAIIEKIDDYDQNIDVHVATIVPNDTYWEDPPDVFHPFDPLFTDYNENLASRVVDIVNGETTSGFSKSNLYIVDINQAFKSHEGWESLLADGTHPTDFGYIIMAKAWFGSINPLPRIHMSCSPASGTAPFGVVITITGSSYVAAPKRQIDYRLDVVKANGVTFPHFVPPGSNRIDIGGIFSDDHDGYIPYGASIIGNNTLICTAMDVTPAPWNQPPYPPSGGTATDTVIVTVHSP